jgi:hypothetical protein
MFHAYVETWKLFRDLTDERSRLSTCVASVLDRRWLARRNVPWALIDVGCGDGALAREVVSRIAPGARPQQVELVDPLWPVCDRATWPSPDCDKVRQLQIDARAFGQLYSSGPPSVLLLVHSAYYVDLADIAALMAYESVESAVVVVNCRRSVFGDIWAITRPDLLDRLEKLWRWVEQCDAETLQVKASLSIPRCSLERILGFLCLRDVGKLSRAERLAVEAVVAQHENCGRIEYAMDLLTLKLKRAAKQVPKALRSWRRPRFESQ